MKKSVIFLILLVICMPISFASNEKIYVYGANGLVASKEGDDITYYNQDFLGSNKIVSDEDGEIIGKNVQYPFGEDYSEKGSKEGLSNNYKFTGQEKDEELYYYGARYYDPSISRFISVDPVFDSRVSPYSYVGNNPLKYVDPNGNARTWYRGVAEFPIDDIIAESSAPGMSVITHILDNPAGSPYISITSDKNVASDFFGKEGKYVEFSSGNVEGRIADPNRVVRMIEEAVESGVGTPAEGKRAIDRVRRHKEGLILPEGNYPARIKNPIQRVKSIVGKAKGFKWVRRMKYFDNALPVFGEAIGGALAYNDPRGYLGDVHDKISQGGFVGVVQRIGAIFDISAINIAQQRLLETEGVMYDVNTGEYYTPTININGKKVPFSI